MCNVLHKGNIEIAMSYMLYTNSCLKEENVLFNDALNTFYLRLWRQTYGKGPLR